MTDAEIVALVARAIRERFPLVLKYEAENLASVAVAALTEAGRLVPDGCVCIDAGRWERVHTVARDAHVWLNADGEESNDKNRAEDALSWSIDGLKPGDLDAELTP